LEHRADQEVERHYRRTPHDDRQEIGLERDVLERQERQQPSDQYRHVVAVAVGADVQGLDPVDQHRCVAQADRWRRGDVVEYPRHQDEWMPPPGIMRSFGGHRAGIAVGGGFRVGHTRQLSMSPNPAQSFPQEVREDSCGDGTLRGVLALNPPCLGLNRQFRGIRRNRHFSQLRHLSHKGNDQLPRYPFIAYRRVVASCSPRLHATPHQTMYYRVTSASLFLAVLAGSVCSQEVQLLSRVPSVPQAAKAWDLKEKNEQPTIARSEFVRVNTAALLSVPTKGQLPLATFGIAMFGKSYIVDINKCEMVHGYRCLTGKVRGRQGDSIFVVAPDRVISYSTVHMVEDSFVIVHANDSNVHVVHLVEPPSTPRVCRRAAALEATPPPRATLAVLVEPKRSTP